MRILPILFAMLASTSAQAGEVFRGHLSSPIILTQEVPPAVIPNETAVTLDIGTPTLPEGRIGRPWTYDFSTATTSSAGNLTGVTWGTDITGQASYALPGTVAITAATGVLAGTPSAIGDYTFALTAAQGGAEKDRQLFTITVGGDVFKAKKVTTGNQHTCAISMTNEVWCWGSNFAGQLGVPLTTTKSLVPVLVAGISGAKEVTAGWSHSCALLTDGTVKCWGSNSAKQLGIATAGKFYTPVTVDGLVASKIDAAAENTCAISTTNSTVWCWGDNYFGQLGLGHGNITTLPGSTGLASATNIAVGESGVCANVGTSVYCWGRQVNGRFGNLSSAVNHMSPTVAPTLAGMTKLSAGDMHFCGINGTTARCIGDSQYGESGTTIGSNATQITMSTGGNASRVYAGGYLTCVSGTTGTIHCLGNNSYGQHANGGSTNVNSTPTLVTALAGAKEADVSGSHACYIFANDELKCSGYGGDGNLGNGGTDVVRVPSAVIRP